jgi:hypothetical protein
VPRSNLAADAGRPPAHPGRRPPARDREPCGERPGDGLEPTRILVALKPPAPSGGGGLPSSLRSSPGQPGEQAPRPARRSAEVKRPCVARAGHVACLPCPIKLFYPTCPCPAPSLGSASLRLDITSYVNLGRAQAVPMRGASALTTTAHLRTSCHAPTRLLCERWRRPARPPPWQGGSPRRAKS